MISNFGADELSGGLRLLGRLEALYLNNNKITGDGGVAGRLANAVAGLSALRVLTPATSLCAPCASEICLHHKLPPPRNCRRS